MPYANSSCPRPLSYVLHLFVYQATTLTPAERLALIIEGLCQAIARRAVPRHLGGMAEGSSKPQDCWKGHGGGLAGPRLAGPFLLLIWRRLRRITARFAARAAARYVANPLAPSCPSSCPSAPRPHWQRHYQPNPLPRRKAWLLILVPETASFASQLRHFLADPEVAILLAAAPKLQSILRPLCHMLNIRAAQFPSMQAIPAQASPPLPDAAPAARAIHCGALPWPAAPQAAPIAVLPVASSPCTTPPPAPAAPLPVFLHALA
jgi:hypothetical protein